MVNPSQIKEHMLIKGSDGKHVGTVIGADGDRLTLISGGMNHDIDLAMVATVEDNIVRLQKTAQEAVKAWH